jgi:peptidyl-prolyl cis-trans isomerase B (cyclophilin B)
MFHSFHKVKFTIFAVLLLILFIGTNCQNKKANTVMLNTNMGKIEIELYPDKAPVSVENFLTYVKSGFYDNTIFHRVIKGFMVQGGGFDENLNKKKTKDPIVNEAGNGLKNLRGTVAYARTGVINSATSQFFINHVDNGFLDFKDSTQTGFGYVVFGAITQGMEIVEKIANVETGVKKGMRDVPTKPVIIKSAKYLGD